MGAWAYCTNEDSQRGFDRPSFAEIIARKRKCPACGQNNHDGDGLGKALDEFEEFTALRDTSGTKTGRYSTTSANTSNKPQSVAAGQEANTAPQLVGTLTCSVGGTAKLRLADGLALPPGYYTVSLTKEH